MSLSGRTAVVTGATRGIGRGLAVALAERGAHVVVTGRTASGPASLADTAAAVRRAGGTCEPFVVDHADDAAVRAFFARLADSLARRDAALDVFVNNAYAAVAFLVDSMDVPFWQKSAAHPATPDDAADPAAVWDLVNNVGLRGNFVCCVYATRLMRPRGGTIVNITSWAGTASIFDPAYSVGKAAVDRLSAEVAAAAPPRVRCLTLCPGFVGTEALLAEARRRDAVDADLPPWNCETPLFVGRVLAALVDRPTLLDRMNGKVVIAAEAAELLRVRDENGFRSLSFRSIRYNFMSWFPFLQTSPLRFLIPRRLYAPWWVVRWLSGAVKFWN